MMIAPLPFLSLLSTLMHVVAAVPRYELLFSRATSQGSSQGPNSLAQQHGKWFGSAYTNGLSSDSTVMKYYNDKSYIGQITPENEMKPSSIDKGGGKFDYSSGDQVVAQADKTGAKVRCHFLLGPNQNGAGLASAGSREQALNYLDGYIKSTVEHYGNKCYSWDVVNEALTQQGTLRSDVPGTSKIGNDFVEQTFKIATKYAPAGTKLCYNDYNLESSSAKLDGAVALAKKVRAAGGRIDCIGFESHISAGNAPSESSYEGALNKAASVVSETPITELDVASSGSDQQQSAAYQTATKTCLNVKSCPGVTVWGISDKHGWLQGKNADILDSSGREKPAVQGIVSALSGSGSNFTQTSPDNTSPTTPTQTTTTPTGGQNTTPVVGGNNGLPNGKNRTTTPVVPNSNSPTGSNNNPATPLNTIGTSPTTPTNNPTTKGNGNNGTPQNVTSPTNNVFGKPGPGGVGGNTGNGTPKNTPGNGFTVQGGGNTGGSKGQNGNGGHGGSSRKRCRPDRGYGWPPRA